MTVVIKEMQGAREFTEGVIAEHLQAFLLQIREKVGVESVVLKQPYLKYAIAENTLKYLKILEDLQKRFPGGDDTEDLEEGGGGGSDFVARLGDERNRFVMNVKQGMDSKRQQEFGMHYYVWRTAGDDRVRPEHAEKEGKVFEWGKGEEPGDAPNCRCSGEMFPKYSKDNDPPLEPVYPLETLLLLWATLGSAIARQIGKEVLDKITGDTPTDKPMPDAPKPDLGDTKTWPSPPKEGGYTEGVPSRTKPQDRGEKSLYDEFGGEWRYAREDKYHNEHWDYKPPGNGSAWENVPIGDKPPVK